MSTLKVLDTLIDKQDNFEIIRDQIAGILACEVENQIAKATTDGKPNPDDWKMRIYIERDNPWNEWLHIDSVKANIDQSPIVNVWYENSDFPADKGDPVRKQMSSTIYNIDIYGLGLSEVTGSGQVAGDKNASITVQTGVRFVRNILMSALNRYLQLQGTVWNRWIQSVTLFQPQFDQQTVQQIVGARIAFRVEFNELSPQIEGVNLDEVGIKLQFKEDGSVFVQLDYTNLET